MLFGSFFAVLLAAQAPEMMIPEGTILPVVLNETLHTARLQDNDPVLFSLAEDIRTAGRRGPVLLPRGSSVVGRVVLSERAGHFVGRSHLDIRVQEIITPTGEVYDGVSSKIIDFAKKKGQKGEVKADGGLQGPVHRKRDTFFLLFPPTTLFQLMATPKRGPDIVLPVETRLYVKLMTPIYVETAPRAITSVIPPRTRLPSPFQFRSRPRLLFLCLLLFHNSCRKHRLHYLRMVWRFWSHPSRSIRMRSSATFSAHRPIRLKSLRRISGFTRLATPAAAFRQPATTKIGTPVLKP